MAAAISALSALIGVAIGAFVSYRTATIQFFGTVVASGQQKWMADLRETLAQFLGLANSAAMTLGERGLSLGEVDVLDIFARINTAKWEVRLLLDPTDSKHEQLIHSLDKVLLVATNRKHIHENRLPPAVEDLTAAAHLVLKAARDRIMTV